MTFILILFFILLYYYLLNSNAKDPKKSFVVIVTIILILLSGLRHPTVGSDTEGTMLRYEQVAKTSWVEVIDGFIDRYLNPTATEGKDPAEYIFFKLLSIISGDGRVMLFAVAIIILSSIGLFIYKNTKTLNAVLFSYVFFVTMFYQYVPNSSVRQPIALAILLYAFSYLKERKYIGFLLLLFFASFFHKSVLVGGLMLPLSMLKNIRTNYFLFIPFFVMTFFYYEFVGTLLVGFNEVYDAYMSSSYYATRSKPFVVIILFSGLYLFCVYAGIPKKSEIIIDRMVYYGTGLTIVLAPLIWLDPSMIRLTCYFGLYMAIAVAESSERNKDARSIMRIIYAIFLIKALMTDDGYYFMWQNVS